MDPSHPSESAEPELGVPESVERIARWLDEISRRTGMPAALSATTPGAPGAASAFGRMPGAIGSAGLGAAQFSATIFGNQITTPGLTGGFAQDLLQQYQISTAELQGFSRSLVHWVAHKVETPVITQEEFEAANARSADEQAPAPLRRSRRIATRRNPEATEEAEEAQALPRRRREAVNRDTPDTAEERVTPSPRGQQRTSAEPTDGPVKEPAALEPAAPEPVSSSAEALEAPPAPAGLLDSPWMRWPATATAIMGAGLAGMILQRQGIAQSAFELARPITSAAPASPLPGFVDSPLNRVFASPFSASRTMDSGAGQIVPTYGPETPALPSLPQPGHYELATSSSVSDSSSRTSSSESTVAAESAELAPVGREQRRTGDAPTIRLDSLPQDEIRRRPVEPDAPPLRTLPPPDIQIEKRAQSVSADIIQKIESSVRALSSALGILTALPGRAAAGGLPGGMALPGMLGDLFGAPQLAGPMGPLRSVFARPLPFGVPGFQGATGFINPNLLHLGGGRAPGEDGFFGPLTGFHPHHPGQNLHRSGHAGHLPVHPHTAHHAGHHVPEQFRFFEEHNLPYFDGKTMHYPGQHPHQPGHHPHHPGHHRRTHGHPLGLHHPGHRVPEQFRLFAEQGLPYFDGKTMHYPGQNAHHPGHARHLPGYPHRPHHPAHHVPEQFRFFEEHNLPYFDGKTMHYPGQHPHHPGQNLHHPAHHPHHPGHHRQSHGHDQHFPGHHGDTYDRAGHFHSHLDGPHHPAHHVPSFFRGVEGHRGRLGMHVPGHFGGRFHSVFGPAAGWAGPGLHAGRHLPGHPHHGLHGRAEDHIVHAYHDTALQPLHGQITLLAAPLHVASEQSEEAGTAVAFDWQSLLPSMAPLDAGALAHLTRSVPGVQAIYPALPPGSLGAVNLPLAAPLLRQLLDQGYGGAIAGMAQSAAGLGAMGHGGRPANQPASARIVPGRRPAGMRSGLMNQEASSQADGAGALAHAGGGQAHRGGALSFLGMPVRLAPSLSGSADVREAAVRLGAAGPDAAARMIRPAEFNMLRNRLFPSLQTVAAEPDLHAWERVRHDFGLRDTKPSTLFAPDARIPAPTASSPLPQMMGGAGHRNRPLGLSPYAALPLLASLGGAEHLPHGMPSPALPARPSGLAGLGHGVAAGHAHEHAPHLPPAIANLLAHGGLGRGPMGAGIVGQGLLSHLAMQGPHGRHTPDRQFRHSGGPGHPHGGGHFPLPGPGTASPYFPPHVPGPLRPFLPIGEQFGGMAGLSPLPGSHSGGLIRTIGPGSVHALGSASGGILQRPSASANYGLGIASPFFAGSLSGGAAPRHTGIHAPGWIGHGTPGPSFAGGMFGSPHASFPGSLSDLFPVPAGVSRGIGSYRTRRPAGSMPTMGVPDIQFGSPGQFGSTSPGHRLTEVRPVKGRIQGPGASGGTGFLTNPGFASPHFDAVDYAPSPTRVLSASQVRHPLAPPSAPGRSSVSSRPMILQRSEKGKSASTHEPQGARQSVQASTASAQDAGGKPYEVHLVANEVWSILKRRLAVEAERQGRR